MELTTIALRFGENFAPAEGTIEAHSQIIQKKGFVWFGKIGKPISNKVIDSLKTDNCEKILLISSGKQDRYWAHIEDITRSLEDYSAVPEYYRDKVTHVGVWFKIVKFEAAPKDIMSKCFIKSSGVSLGLTSRSSMNPFFIIKCDETQGN